MRPTYQSFSQVLIMYTSFHLDVWHWIHSSTSFRLFKERLKSSHLWNYNCFYKGVTGEVSDWVNKVLVCMSFGCCDSHLSIMALDFIFNQNFKWFICNIASLKSRWSICCYVSNLQRNSWQSMQRLQCIFSMFGAEHEPPVQLNRTVQSIAQEFHGGCITASTATSSLWGMDGERTGNTFPLGSSSLLCCGYYLHTNNHPLPLTFVLTIPTY